MREQSGYVFKAFDAWHVRFYVSYNDLPVEEKEKIARKCELKGKPIPTRVQKSRRLCTYDGEHKTARSALVKEAYQKVMDEINGLVPGEVIQHDLTIADFWEKTYWPFVEKNCKTSTQWGYRQVWAQNLKPHFGTKTLKEYRTHHGSLFLTKLAERYGHHTIQHIRSLASGIFSHAVNVGAIESNPWHDVKVLGKTKEPGETKHYTLEEVENIISALVDHVECQLIMALAFFLGLRKGEVQGLKWEDFDGEWLHIRRAVARGVVGTPKTKKSIRTLPLIAPVRIPLQLWRKKSGSPVAGWVFPNKKTGNPIEIRTLIRCVIVPTLTREKIEWKGIHAARRGTGTILRKLTGNSTAGRDVLGHEDEATTKDHYEGALPEEAMRAMRLLEQAATKSLNK